MYSNNGIILLHAEFLKSETIGRVEAADIAVVNMRSCTSWTDTDFDVISPRRR